MGGAVTLAELRAMDAAQLAELIAFELIREQEEARERSPVAGDMEF